VLLRTRSGHAAIVNTAALAAARIGQNEKDPAGGRFERLPNGRLNGVLREYAWWLVERRIADLVSDAEALTEWRETLAQAARFGITSIQDMSPSLPPERVVALLEKVPSALRVRLIRMPLTSAAGRDLTEGWPAPRVSNPLIKVSGIKWVADGTPTEGTFAPRQDAAGDASARNRYLAHLQLMFPEGEYAAMLRESLAHNEQLLLHVSGYPAAEVVLGAMKASGGRAAWEAKRVRFEHGSGLLPDLLPLVKELGIIVVQNPTHLNAGSAEAIKAKPLRSLLAAGIPLALGSDGPRNPYVDIMLAATHPDRPDEAITREQAVIAYTLTSAYAEFEEKEKGSLEPGKLADLAVLSQDIFAVPLPELPKTESVLSLVGGKVVYDAKVVGSN
jgi:predicted amidohydrolase YtcJ